MGSQLWLGKIHERCETESQKAQITEHLHGECMEYELTQALFPKIAVTSLATHELANQDHTHRCSESITSDAADMSE